MPETNVKTNRGNKCHSIAWAFFFPEGNGKAMGNCVLHHKDMSLKEKDIERYNKWLPEDLVVMTQADHRKLHLEMQGHPMQGKHHDDVARAKISASHTGVSLSEDHKKKIRESSVRPHKNSRAIVQIYPDGRKVTWNYLAEASRSLGGNYHANIIRAINTGRTCCGCHWHYKEDK